MTRAAFPATDCVPPRRTRGPTFAAVLALLLALAGPAAAQRGSDPEGATGLEPKTLALARSHMVSAANPHATAAGLEILRAGGSAVDAMIAVQLALNVVEPQSSGLGGGAFLLHWDQGRRQIKAYDGREAAPLGARPDLFLRPDGRPRSFPDAAFSGHSVGVPGLLALLSLAHERHGRLPWARLFDPAIRLAETGFPVPRRLSLLAEQRGAKLLSAAARALLFVDGERAPRVDDTHRNPELARTLRQIAASGARILYRGPLADDIVAAVRAGPQNAGAMTWADLARYQARERPPVCVGYRRYRVCGIGPPSSGGLAVGMTLKLIEPFELGSKPLGARAIHVIAEAQKLAYADRDQYVADPDFVALPAGLTDPRYLAQRRRLIDPLRAMSKAEPGQPPALPRRRAGVDATEERGGTSHVSIVDRWGNAVALTTSIESAFGSGLMAGGFLLNNQLTDFSFLPTDSEGRPIANAMAPGKRPRSSMSPTLVLDPAGRLFAVLGSAGGPRIPLYVVKAIVALIDWRLDAQAAADLANFGSRNGPLEIEADAVDEDTMARLRALGHEMAGPFMTSGTHIVVRRRNGMLEGGVDPRREGLASGD